LPENEGVRDGAQRGICLQMVLAALSNANHSRRAGGKTLKVAKLEGRCCPKGVAWQGVDPGTVTYYAGQLDGMGVVKGRFMYNVGV
jgi:hypothetical protein